MKALTPEIRLGVEESRGKYERAEVGPRDNTVTGTRKGRLEGWRIRPNPGLPKNLCLKKYKMHPGLVA